jgi:diguanylate cyclase (GGDEF)-like protein
MMIQTGLPWYPCLCGPRCHLTSGEGKKSGRAAPASGGYPAPGDWAGAGRRASLLIVSEQADVLSEVSALVADEFDVRTAHSVERALPALTAGDFDLLLADQALGSLTGLQLLDWVRRSSPRTVGLLLISPADVQQAGEALRQGLVHACVLQPLRADGLLAALRGAVGRCRRERSQALVQQELQRLQIALQPRALEQVAALLARNTADLEEDNRQLRQQSLAMEWQASTDPLTGLLNRRAIEAIADHEVRRRARYPGPLALGLIDADHFKEINSRYLHPGGDQALIGLSRALVGSLRSADRVGRFGGEEFLVVAPQTDQHGATALAERLRAAVGQTPICYHGQAIAVTISIGFAVVEAGKAADCNELRHLAAAALAAAKEAGRNCSVVRTLGVAAPLAG